LTVGFAARQLEAIATNLKDEATERNGLGDSATDFNTLTGWKRSVLGVTVATRQCEANESSVGNPLEDGDGNITAPRPLPRSQRRLTLALGTDAVGMQFGLDERIME